MKKTQITLKALCVCTSFLMPNLAEAGRPAQPPPSAKQGLGVRAGAKFDAGTAYARQKAAAAGTAVSNTARSGYNTVKTGTLNTMDKGKNYVDEKRIKSAQKGQKKQGANITRRTGKLANYEEKVAQATDPNKKRYYERKASATQRRLDDAQKKQTAQSQKEEKLKSSVGRRQGQITGEVPRQSKAQRRAAATSTDGVYNQQDVTRVVGGQGASPTAAAAGAGLVAGSVAASGASDAAKIPPPDRLLLLRKL